MYFISFRQRGTLGPAPGPLELHTRYGSLDISTALGLTTIAQTGQTGVGVLHAPGLKAYAMLITFQKTEREFSRGYTILLFARDVKQRNAATVPFTYLGPADLQHHESEWPIKVFWRLRHPMPAEMFEMNRRGG